MQAISGIQFPTTQLTPTRSRSPDVECRFGEGTALQQGHKSGMAANWIPFGIGRQENEVNVARVVGSIQPV